MKVNLYLDFEVNVFTDKEKWNKFAKKYGENYLLEDGVNGGATHFHDEKGDSQFGVYLNIENYHYRVAIHESVHIVDCLCEYLRIDDTEFRAYSIEHLSIEIIDYMINLLDKEES